MSENTDEAGNKTEPATDTADDATKLAIDDLLDEYSDRFPDDLTDMPPDRPVFHTIPLQDANVTPPFKSMYRLTRPEHDEVQKQVLELLRKGYIDSSSLRS